MQKINDFFNKHFHMIFRNSHLLYTLIFLLSALIIAILSFIPDPGIGNVILFLATTFAFAFILLMFEALIPQLEPYIFFSKEKFDLRKTVCFLVNYFIGFAIILPYFLTGSSTQLAIQFLGWNIILPAIFIIIYFGWNLVQIFFLRIGFESASVKVDSKIDDKFGGGKKKNSIDLILLIIALIIPVLIQLGTFFGFLPEFLPPSGDPVEPLIWYSGCNVIILVIIIITSWRLITLFHKSRKNNYSNSYSSVFYILIWLIIWFRSFSFFNSLRGAIQNTTGLDILTRLIDIFLMLLTAFLVLKSLGDKVYESVIFNKNNMPFFLFAFTLLYIEGQIILITGAGSLTGVFADRNQINLINNFLIIIVTVSYYWWYSAHSLERKGYITKSLYYPDEVILIVNDFKDYLESRNALDTNKVGDTEIQNFLDSKNIVSQEEKPLEEKENLKSKESNEEV
jgi:hypothetical protein